MVKIKMSDCCNSSYNIDTNRNLQNIVKCNRCGKNCAIVEKELIKLGKQKVLSLN